MSSSEFIAWAMERPRGERYELVAGEVVAMAPERSSHALTKGRVYRRLAEAIEAADLPGTVYHHPSRTRQSERHRDPDRP